MCVRSADALHCRSGASFRSQSRVKLSKPCPLPQPRQGTNAHGMPLAQMTELTHHTAAMLPAAT
jgi:hypothetical protein